MYVEAPSKERRKFMHKCGRKLTGEVLEFESFLRYAVELTEKGYYNRHWEPAFLRCDICHHNYTLSGE